MSWLDSSWLRDHLTWSELQALARTTTVRVAALQAAIVIAFVAVVIAMVYNETVGAFERDAQRGLEREFAQVVALYNESGLRRVSQDMIERSAAPGPLMYMLTDPGGAVIVGDFNELPRADVSETLRAVEFPAEVERANGEIEGVRVRGVIGRLDIGGPILLVARDMSAQDADAQRIRNLLIVGMSVGLFVALAAGLLAGRQAARRAEELSRTTRDVMAGDLGRRARIPGGNDEFNRLALDLNAMLDRLQSVVMQMRTAGDAIAHDLRSPLTRMRSRLEAALESPPNTDGDRDALIRTMEETNKLLTTFSAVMQIARLESQDPWRFEPTDVSQVAAEFAEFWEPVVEEAGLQFSSNVTDGLIALGDPRLLGQAISNLIENAVKYTPAGGAISVDARRRTDGAIEILVEDDGPGIPPQDRGRVLDRFTRLEAHRNSPGAGLGLSLVAGVARVHKGRIELRDGRRPGSGIGLGAALILPAFTARP